MRIGDILDWLIALLSYLGVPYERGKVIIIIACIGATIWALFSKKVGKRKRIATVISSTLVLFLIFITGEINLPPKEMLIAEGENGSGFCLIAEYNGDLVEAVTWTSGDPTIAKIDASGVIEAVSEGTVCITASADGYVDATYRVTVYPESTEVQTETVRYLETIPSGIDQNHSDFMAISEDYDISPIKPDDVDKDQGWKMTETTVIGYVYWHWCRGLRNDTSVDIDPYDDDGNPHNRRSFPERTTEDINNDGINRDDHFHEFSCFFSDYFLSTKEMYFDRDTEVDAHYGRSVWYSETEICRDSYWFWFVPVCESTYEKHIPILAIRKAE